MVVAKTQISVNIQTIPLSQQTSFEIYFKIMFEKPNIRPIFA